MPHASVGAPGERRRATGAVSVGRGGDKWERGPTGLALFVLAVALILPWTTRYVPAGLTAFAAVTATPTMLFVLASEVLIGLWITARDRWLGVFVIYMALNALRTPLEVQPLTVTQAVTFGALILVAARSLTHDWHRVVKGALIVSGLLQVALVLAQWVGVDPIWGAGAPYVQDRQLPGSLGHGNWLGVYLAMVGALAPAWAWPLVVVGLVLSQSRLGLIALALGLLARYAPAQWLFRGRLRYQPRWIGWVIPLVILGSLALAMTMDKTRTTWAARREIWRLGVSIWAMNAPLLGLGPGSWSTYVPSAQQAFSMGLCPGACFVQAHNEVLQLLFEGGAVGLVIFGLWLWEHRHAVHGPYGGAFVALGVCCLGMFPFHLAQLAVPALVIVGLATAGEERVGG